MRFFSQVIAESRRPSGVGDGFAGWSSAGGAISASPPQSFPTTHTAAPQASTSGKAHNIFSGDLSSPSDPPAPNSTIRSEAATTAAPTLSVDTKARRSTPPAPAEAARSAAESATPSTGRTARKLAGDLAQANSPPVAEHQQSDAQSSSPAALNVPQPEQTAAAEPHSGQAIRARNTHSPASQDSLSSSVSPQLNSTEAVSEEEVERRRDSAPKAASTRSKAPTQSTARQDAASSTTYKWELSKKPKSSAPAAANGKQARPPQVRIGQVNVIVEKRGDKRRGKQESPAHDSSSRSFLRGV